MNKADFKKWLEENVGKQHVETYFSWYANKFAEDFAKTEAIECLMHTWKYNRETATELYQKFKDIEDGDTD